MSKHDPAPLYTYFQTHNTWMNALKSEGFILNDTLILESIEGTPFLKMKGDIFLQDNLKMHVNKTLRVHKRRGREYVQTIEYAYNLSLEKIGNIFRYDNMHAHYGHIAQDHLHLYEPPGELIKLTEIRNKQDVPTLGEALNEARAYIDWADKYSCQLQQEIIESPSTEFDY